MKHFTLAAALSLAAILPFTATTAFAHAAESEVALCDKTPAKAAKAGIDCAATSSVAPDPDAAGKSYPPSPVTVGNGIVY